MAKHLLSSQRSPVPTSESGRAGRVLLAAFLWLASTDLTAQVATVPRVRALQHEDTAAPVLAAASDSLLALRFFGGSRLLLVRIDKAEQPRTRRLASAGDRVTQLSLSDSTVVAFDYASATVKEWTATGRLLRSWAIGSPAADSLATIGRFADGSLLHTAVIRGDVSRSDSITIYSSFTGSRELVRLGAIAVGLHRVTIALPADDGAVTVSSRTLMEAADWSTQFALSPSGRTLVLMHRDMADGVASTTRLEWRASDGRLLAQQRLSSRSWPLVSVLRDSLVTAVLDQLRANAPAASISRSELLAALDLPERIPDFSGLIVGEDRVGLISNPHTGEARLVVVDQAGHRCTMRLAVGVRPIALSAVYLWSLRTGTAGLVFSRQRSCRT